MKMLTGSVLRTVFLSVVTALVLPVAHGADAPESAKPCAECHGENGVSSESDIPIIAGASAFFIENQLLIYKEGARPCAKEEFDEADDPPADDHCALANDLSEEEVMELAEYFSSQPFVPADQSVDQELAELGKNIHERRCDKCHSEGGSLVLDDAGILAGQWKEYLLTQLRHYKADERWQPEKMKPQMDELDDEEIKALAEYYVSQGEKRF